MTQSNGSELLNQVDEWVLRKAWEWGRSATLLDLSNLDRPEDATNEKEIRDAYLLRLHGLDLVRRRLGDLVDNDVAKAREFGAETSELSGSLGITRQAIEKRWPSPGERAAVVIARRNRVYVGGDGTRYGEIGGAEQYDADRRWFAVGAKVRKVAQFAIIAVDGIVDRTYEIDPASWVTRDGKSSYSAKHNRRMTAVEIEAAGDALPLRPGDQCATRAGGSYRPLWF